MARNLRYSLAVDEIMHRALESLSSKNGVSKSTYVYNTLRNTPEINEEMARVYRNIYGTEYVPERG